MDKIPTGAGLLALPHAGPVVRRRPYLAPFREDWLDQAEFAEKYPDPWGEDRPMNSAERQLPRLVRWLRSLGRSHGSTLGMMALVGIGALGLAVALASSGVRASSQADNTPWLMAAADAEAGHDGEQMSPPRVTPLPANTHPAFRALVPLRSVQNLDEVAAEHDARPHRPVTLPAVPLRTLVVPSPPIPLQSAEAPKPEAAPLAVPAQGSAPAPAALPDSGTGAAIPPATLPDADDLNAVADPSLPRYLIMAGSYADADNARSLHARLDAQGYPVHLWESPVRDIPMTHVQVGPFRDAQAARQVLARIIQEVAVPARMVAL
ncbi:MAG: SPOR domain-containing protein [Magnetococcus sp. WYHC-3]